MGSGTATQVSVRDYDTRSVPTLKNDSPVNGTLTCPPLVREMGLSLPIGCREERPEDWRNLLDHCP